MFVLCTKSDFRCSFRVFDHLGVRKQWSVSGGFSSSLPALPCFPDAADYVGPGARHGVHSGNEPGRQELFSGGQETSFEHYLKPQASLHYLIVFPAVLSGWCCYCSLQTKRPRCRAVGQHPPSPLHGWLLRCRNFPLNMYFLPDFLPA